MHVYACSQWSTASFPQEERCTKAQLYGQECRMEVTTFEVGGSSVRHFFMSFISVPSLLLFVSRLDCWLLVTPLPFPGYIFSKWFKEKKEKKKKKKEKKTNSVLVVTCIAVRAATIAGLPNPCDMREKWVRCLCMLGSRMCCGRVLQSGDLSWFKRSISSLVICLWKRRGFHSLLHVGYVYTRQKNETSRVILTWWHEEVLFFYRNLAARNAAGWDTRRLVSRGTRFRKRSQSLWQDEWLLLENIKYSCIIARCHYINWVYSLTMYNGRRKRSRNFIWLWERNIADSLTQSYEFPLWAFLLFLSLSLAFIWIIWVSIKILTDPKEWRNFAVTLSIQIECFSFHCQRSNVSKAFRSSVPLQINIEKNLTLRLIIFAFNGNLHSIKKNLQKFNKNLKFNENLVEINAKRRHIYP